MLSKDGQSSSEALSVLAISHRALQATQDKNAAVAQAEKTAGKARLAERLISGLAGEFQRWSRNIEEFTAAEGGYFFMSCNNESCHLQDLHFEL